jgi:hypothetical protein
MKYVNCVSVKIKKKTFLTGVVFNELNYKLLTRVYYYTMIDDWLRLYLGKETTITCYFYQQLIISNCY